jgi:hypothetical protein
MFKSEISIFDILIMSPEIDLILGFAVFLLSEYFIVSCIKIVNW